MRGLPADSLTHAGWTTAEHLAALNAEVTFEVVRTVLAANTKQGTRLPDPLHVPRPGEVKPGPRKASGAEIAAFFKGG